MNGGTFNIHATAVVLGTRGILFKGPSGSGKSILAFACIADDQVFVSRHGEQLVASRPDPIAGLIEVRGSGIAKVESIAAAVLDLAVAVIPHPESERLPPENERFSIAGIGELPLIRIWQGTRDPLAVLAAFAVDLHGEIPF